MSPTPAPHPSILVEHARADRELEAIANALSRRADVLAAVEALDDELAVHFAEEERELLPGYALDDPDDAALIRAQHGRLRELLSAMRARAERDTFDDAALRELRIALHLHHTHEETGLYRWLERRRADALRSA